MTAALHRFCRIAPHPTTLNWPGWGLAVGALIALGQRLRQSAKAGAGEWLGLFPMVVGDRGGLKHLNQGHEPPGVFDVCSQAAVGS
ncbi:hypothetical protein [Halomicronema sp. CCY15110]|uniref:hypothetical protein n=1 Tax=Halomicronema sp. CCY15110 TaxID=2767773 RepID=UPI00194F173B|nr:hypothetical protein [Halomicronema sp. CCY15110]